jgi:hypothetical protein
MCRLRGVRVCKCGGRFLPGQHARRRGRGSRSPSCYSNGQTVRAGTQVVGKGKLRPETRTSRAGGHGHAYRPSASHRVGGEFLANAANGAAAHLETDCWGSRSGALTRSAALCIRRRLARCYHMTTGLLNCINCNPVPRGTRHRPHEAL